MAVTRNLLVKRLRLTKPWRFTVQSWYVYIVYGCCWFRMSAVFVFLGTVDDCQSLLTYFSLIDRSMSFVGTTTTLNSKRRKQFGTPASY
jgi:hypothetical protein